MFMMTLTFVVLYAMTIRQMAATDLLDTSTGEVGPDLEEAAYLS